jgi:hypothetical protein
MTEGPCARSTGRAGASLWVGLLTLAIGGLAAAAPPTPVSTAAAPRAARSTTPAQATPEIIPVSEIRAGMRGYGLTVFQGTKPERFEVKVISVLHHFLPKQDIILIQSDDPRLLHSGIVAGMSGSPIYLEGRLAGALAYGWNFAKDPIAGVTPIESMLAEMKRPLRGKLSTPSATAMNDSAPPVVAPTGQSTEPRLVRAAVPLSISGFTSSAISSLTEAFAPYGMVPLSGGGAGKKPATPRPPGAPIFEPGSAIAVQLVRGDVSVAATGTVTYVSGDKVLAFGHPMFNVGEVYLPIATAEVHTFMSALSSSFKLSSPIEEVGTLLQDRQSCILADVSQRTDMIPVTVTVAAGRGRPEQTFHTEVVRHRFLTPILATSVVDNAAKAVASDVADATITLRSNLAVRGHKPLELVDHLYSPDGVSSRTLMSATGVKAIGDLLFNPFSPANLDKIDVRVEVDYKADVAEIVGVSLTSDELEPGSRPALTVTLRPYAGKETTQTIPLEIPRALAGQTVKLVATAGNLARPETAPPENLAGYIDNLRKGYPARSIVVSLETPDEGVIMRGSVIPDLPGSVIDTLRPGASTRRADTFKRALRLVVPTRGIVTGKQEITVHIREER